MGTSYLVNDKAPITTYNLKTTSNPSQGKAGTCSGDSGGPVLRQGHRHGPGRDVVRA